MTIEAEIATLYRLSTRQLQQRFAELTGDATVSCNRAWLLKRLAWRLQAQAHGGLSPRACQRARDIAQEADLRLLPPREVPDPATKPATLSSDPVPLGPTAPGDSNQADRRLPPPGSVLVRKYKGRELHVTVLAAGFEWQGRLYPSLSAVAKAITGSHCNGYLFFHLKGERRSS